MTPQKRALDIALALLLSVALSPIIIGIALTLWFRQGRPILHVSTRMRSPGRRFGLLKFRTMRPDPRDAGVTGGDKSMRITPMGQLLRRTRGDELPQLWNVLRGDISFVGPRPPLPRYVDLFPDLYAEVLKSRPGITGLATLRYHAHEERLLSRCADAAGTEAVYVARCIPRKAKLDLIYLRNRSLCLDLKLIGETAQRILPRRPRRALNRGRSR